MCYWGDFCWRVFLLCCVVVCLQLLQLLASSEQEFWNTMCSHNSWVSTRCDQSWMAPSWLCLGSKQIPSMMFPILNCQVLDSGLQVSFSLGQDLTKWLLYLVDGIPSLEFLWIVIIVLSVLGCFWNWWRGYNYCFVEVATECDGFEVLDEEDFLIVQCSISFQTSWDVVVHLFWTMWICCPCLQIWRLLTNFIFLGPFSMQFGVRILMM